MADLADDLDAYAALAVALADPAEDRTRLLAEHGLDEERWQAIDDTWQARVSSADDVDDDAVGVPELVSAYAEAFANAQRARAAGVLAFDRFLEVTREMTRGVALATALERHGVSLEDYLGAQRHWTQRMLEDDALSARFRRRVR